MRKIVFSTTPVMIRPKSRTPENSRTPSRQFNATHPSCRTTATKTTATPSAVKKNLLLWRPPLTIIPSVREMAGFN
jgi:hypothetical protein